MGLLIPESAPNADGADTLSPGAPQTRASGSTPIAPAGPRPRYSLYVKSGPGAGQLFPLGSRAVTLGRSSTSNLRLSHEGISRQHAEVFTRGDRVFVRDLGSRNGTLLNGAPVAGEYEVKASDELTLGISVVVLRERTGERSLFEQEIESRYRPARRWSLAVGAVIGALLATFVAFVATSPRPAPALTLPSQTRAAVASAAAASRAGVAATTDVRVSPVSAEPNPFEAAERLNRLRMPTVPATAPQDSASGSASAFAPRAARLDASGHHNAAIFSRYDRGNVDAALALAKDEGDTVLETALSQFRSLYQAGVSEMEARRDAEAARDLAAALSVDRALASGGSGRYGPELRDRLESLQARAKR